MHIYIYTCVCIWYRYGETSVPLNRLKSLDSPGTEASERRPARSPSGTSRPRTACPEAADIHIHSHIDMYIHVYTCIYTYIHVDIYTYIHTYIYLWTITHAYMYTCAESTCKNTYRCQQKCDYDEHLNVIIGV